MSAPHYPPLAHLLKTTAPIFAKRCLESLKTVSPNLSSAASSFVCDHICFRTSTQEEYEFRKSELEGSGPFTGCIKLVEAEIGGRPIATYRLPDSLAVEVDDSVYKVGGEDGWGGHGRFGKPGKRMIRVIELPSPKKGRAYLSGWEHVEYAIATEEEMQEVAGTLKACLELGTRDVDERLAGETLMRRARERLEACREKLDSDGVKIRYNEEGMEKKEVNMDYRIDFEAATPYQEGVVRVAGGEEVDANGGVYAVGRAKEEEGDSAELLMRSFCVKLHWLPLELVISLETNEMF